MIQNEPDISLQYSPCGSLQPGTQCDPIAQFHLWQGAEIMKAAMPILCLKDPPQMEYAVPFIKHINVFSFIVFLYVSYFPLGMWGQCIQAF